MRQGRAAEFFFTRAAFTDNRVTYLTQRVRLVNKKNAGMCADCGLKVVGEGSGCTAMDRVFHIACFTCRMCNCRLQGKPFYAVEGEPHCQECYLVKISLGTFVCYLLFLHILPCVAILGFQNSLEKCCVCAEPILDRILRATGKPYHPQCFTCIVCNVCLDGIPFTVDAANRIHCIDDFHKYGFIT